MKEYLISMYIDDELDLDRKISFIESVHGDTGFRQDALDLLRQEKMIRRPVAECVPAVEFPARRKRFLRILRPAGFFVSGLAAALILLVVFLPRNESTGEPRVTHRFVLYQPDAKHVDLAGSFTGWSTVPMTRTGQSGYWEATLQLKPTEHRFSYILEGERRIPDPTVLAREDDDFGGENSILNLSVKT
ncbi:glycogen-binding domain-containing protein [Thermodesulfobacteriota bacterium]